MTVEPDQSIVQSIAQLWREMGSVGGKLDSLQLEGYLAWKWGLEEDLPLDHPYRFDGSLFGYGSAVAP